MPNPCHCGCGCGGLRVQSKMNSKSPWPAFTLGTSGCTSSFSALSPRVRRHQDSVFWEWSQPPPCFLCCPEGTLAWGGIRNSHTRYPNPGVIEVLSLFSVCTNWLHKPPHSTSHHLKVRPLDTVPALYIKHRILPLEQPYHASCPLVLSHTSARCPQSPPSLQEPKWKGQAWSSEEGKPQVL